ncbi:MAG: hypothetical protein L0241_16910 [Planctomycetia bacterium]|nr:hypothetical protein [Planctomycetia bacterium]
MFAHLLRAPDTDPTTTSRTPNTVRLVCERLEERMCPVVVMVNTDADTQDKNMGDGKIEDKTRGRSVSVHCAGETRSTGG